MQDLALNAVLLRPLPFRAPEQLAMLWSDVPSQNIREGRTAYADIEQWRRQRHTFSEMAFFDPVSATLTVAGESHHISVNRVSPAVFSLLDIRVLHGRAFTALEADQRQRVALVSHSFWQRWLGASPEAGSYLADSSRTRLYNSLRPR